MLARRVLYLHRRIADIFSFAPEIGTQTRVMYNLLRKSPILSPLATLLFTLRGKNKLTFLLYCE
jgi:hypothetical protein